MEFTNENCRDRHCYIITIVILYNVILINAHIPHGVRLMARLQLQPPEQFDFKNPDEWPRWSKRFEQFRVASGLSDESDTRQVCTLLYCLGNEAEDVLRSTNISEEDQKKYKEVREKFDAFFK